MNCQKVSDTIVSWLRDQAKGSGLKGFVIGVSGGIDSAVTSTLCAKTHLPTIVLNLPILQKFQQVSLSTAHCHWLAENFDNVSSIKIDLSKVFGTLKNELSIYVPIISENQNLALANSKSRLRMVTLYYFANLYSYLVCGTGNKVEDFGLGFFTKYGDGGVDISPIGDLLKTEVRELARYLGVNEEIIKAAPTDGLWDDGRTDESQIGATYEEMEWAMDWQEYHSKHQTFESLEEQRKQVLKTYLERHNQNLHKMKMPPICEIKDKK